MTALLAPAVLLAQNVLEKILSPKQTQPSASFERTLQTKQATKPTPTLNDWFQSHSIRSVQDLNKCASSLAAELHQSTAENQGLSGPMQLRAENGHLTLLVDGQKIPLDPQTPQGELAMRTHQLKSVQQLTNCGFGLQEAINRVANTPLASVTWQV